MSGKQPPPATTPARRQIFPDWYRAVATITLGILLVLGLAYAFGASGFTYRGAAIDFGRRYDRQLYKIDSEKAFAVDADDRVDVVRYGEVPPIVMPCGCYKGRKAFVISAGFRKGSWVYTRYPMKGFSSALNLKTGELIEGEDLPRSHAISAALELDGYREHGFDFDPEHSFSGKDVAKSYEPMSTSKEGCITIFIAEALVLALLALIAPFAWLQQRSRNRRP
ncbi:MAG: hypothetical protein ACHREM_01785 [Polyangiales bacterium]